MTRKHFHSPTVTVDPSIGDAIHGFYASIINAPKSKLVLLSAAQTRNSTSPKICTCIVLTQKGDHKVFSQPTQYCNFLGIHVRRGDKVGVKTGWAPPEKPYFDTSMNYFRSKYNKTVYFVVVAEDKNWARSNVVGKDIIDSTSNEDLLELALLTLCDHGMISVGTFGWWAAYLTG